MSDMATILAIGWLTSGVLGSILVLEFMFRRDGHNITIGLVMFGALMSIVGVGNLGAGIVGMALYYRLPAIVLFSKVVISGRESRYRRVRHRSEREGQPR